MDPNALRMVHVVGIKHPGDRRLEALNYALARAARERPVPEDVYRIATVGLPIWIEADLRHACRRAARMAPQVARAAHAEVQARARVRARQKRLEAASAEERWCEACGGGLPVESRANRRWCSGACRVAGHREIVTARRL